MRANEFNRMKTSTVENCIGPIDRVALLQMIRGPECNIEHLDIRTNAAWSESPIACQTRPHGFADLTGRRRGTVVVMGFFGQLKRTGKPTRHKPQTHRNYWVTKCDCGGYQLINQRTLLKPEKGLHMCARCEQIRDIKRGFGNYKSSLKSDPKGYVL